MMNIVSEIIRDEIRSMSPSKFYPSTEELADIEFLENWLPKSLVILLQKLIPNKLKRTAIGHSITLACRQNIMSPLLIGLGVELDHSFGSKWLNNHLSWLGFSVSNQMVSNFRAAVVEEEDTIRVILPDSFIQWSADNVDHNIGTLDVKILFMVWV